MNESTTPNDPMAMLAMLPPETVEQFRQVLLGDPSEIPEEVRGILRLFEIEPPDDAHARIDREIAELGLERNVAELADQGYTVVRDAFDDAFAARMRARLLEVADEDDREGVVTMGGSRGPTGRTVFRLVERGRVFEEAAMNPKLVAIMGRVLGPGFTISTFTGMIRPAGTPKLPLHSDNQFMPAPFPEWNQVATAVWYLEDLKEEHGPSRVVPGSRKIGRHPKAGEGEDRAVAVEAPKGSLVIWVGNTWHGNCARTAPGERVTLHTAFSRMHVRSLESYADLPDEVLARNPPLFAQLVGRSLPFGYDKSGPKPLNMLRAHLLTHSA